MWDEQLTSPAQGDALIDQLLVTEPMSSSPFAVAATSMARFSSLFSLLATTGHAVDARAVLVIGVPRLGFLESYLAPTTGFIQYRDVQADAVRAAHKAARDTAMSLSWEVVARHCVCTGWRDAALRDSVHAYGCQRLFVHPSDLPPWRTRGVRRRLSDVGVSLVVMNPKSTSRGDV